ncbi:hypothetical protein GE09DRAFT_265964 [Coniochaeta sp. 2T2.1]|nr:hypothetical protein GE09DRAFT_265964 [Coniochaeta sp. 2T2.1]
MSARRFKADIGAAAAKVQQGDILGVTAIGSGDSDGEVVITYSHAGLPHAVRIQALAQDPSEYPDGNNFMLFTDSEDAPPEVMQAMELAQEYLLGVTVTEMVSEVAKRLTSALTPSSASQAETDDDGDEFMTDYNDNETPEDEDSESEDDDDFMGHDDEYFGLGSPKAEQPRRSPADNNTSLFSLNQHAALQQRIKSDVQTVKKAGFRVGGLNGFGITDIAGIISISLRVSRLGLSEEALIAWDVPATDYVVLLIKYDTKYVPLESLIDLPAAHCGVRFRIGLCKSYKPSVSDAREAFNSLTDGASASRDHAAQPAFRAMFLSASLDQFMNESLISLIKIRLQRNASWDFANELFHHNGSLGMGGGGAVDLTLPGGEDEPGEQGDGMFDHMLHEDHLAEAGATGSFPLVAMQFAMRYFAKCTKYCLRCHRKVEEGFEALRPYVCSNPLCLFQYMAMGLGPNVEHEILTEPSVVDLLVSLCYASLQATASRHPSATLVNTNPNATPTTFPIREFPVGLHLRVPNILTPQPDRPSPILATLHHKDMGLAFSDFDDVKRLVPNQWIVLRYRLHAAATPLKAGALNPLEPPIYSATHHARITAVFPEKKYATVTMMESGPECFLSIAREADVSPYDVDFDNLTNHEKSVIMQTILSTLPPILKIGDYLREHPSVSLGSYEAVSPAAASLLIWIVSSNRSCINEISTLEKVTAPATNQQPGQEPHKDTGLVSPSVHEWRLKEKRKKEYIPGMNGYIQFRFSQGSPDKELRFNKALQELGREKDVSQYPTIFAWHGSDVANWHSILRTGLDFKEIKYGRAFGNGVYFSPFLGTSIAYASSPYGTRWMNSALNVQMILSLNEIINVPERFVSRTPHYVVQEHDWHQCRYLFVSSQSSGVAAGIKGDAAGVPMLEQDPSAPVLDAASKPLRIPVASMPVRTAKATQAISYLATRNVAQVHDEESEESSAEDQELLADEQHAGRSRSSSVDTVLARDVPGKAPPTPVPEESVTDFTPGKLNLATLPRLAPPSWATPTASRAIGREVHKLQQLQNTTTLRELGWYINFDAITNMFQWIVELHSFDLSIPLARDMQTADIQSIVMEFRFGRDWPMSPPFVRAVRPRFKLFMHGGGGHVTAGGAMCMELLTNSGWSPANSMESVILQVRMALCSEERGARLDLSPVGRSMGDYGVGEAVEAYKRAANAHGWAVPKDLELTARGGAP